MKTVICLLILGAASARLTAFGQEAPQTTVPKVLETLTTLDGTAYKHVTMQKREGPRVLIFHSGGAIWLQISNLPEAARNSLDLPTMEQLETETQNAEVQGREHPAKGQGREKRDEPVLAGPYPYRTPEGRRRAAELFGCPVGTEDAIAWGLRWLAKVQESNGSWDCKKWGGGSEDNAVTGLALLAFLGIGCTDKYPTELAPTVKKAIEYLVAEEEKEKGKGKQGFFGERMYTQGICTMALCEAFAMTSNRNLREPAQKAINYIFDQQPAAGGFGYGGPGNDMSVSGFQFQAIKAAVTAGLEVRIETWEKCENFLRAALSKDYSTPYRVPGNNGTPRMTASSLTSRLFIGHKRTAPDCIGQADWATQQNYYDNKSWATPQKTDMYYIYYMSLSMFQMGGQYWEKWNKNFNAPLRAVQEKNGPNKGSWPNRQDVYGGQGGRVFSTAMACLALECYFRYEPQWMPARKATGQPDNAAPNELGKQAPVLSALLDKLPEPLYPKDGGWDNLRLPKLGEWCNNNLVGRQVTSTATVTKTSVAYIGRDRYRILLECTVDSPFETMNFKGAPLALLFGDRTASSILSTTLEGDEELARRWQNVVKGGKLLGVQASIKEVSVSSARGFPDAHTQFVVQVTPWKVLGPLPEP